MTKYLFLTTIFAITHAGRTKTKPQNRANTTQMKTEVLRLPEQKLKSISSNNSLLEISPAQSDTSSNGLTPSINSRKSSQEIIREIQEQNTKLLMKLDPLRDELAKIKIEFKKKEVEFKKKENQLQEKTIQLETIQKYSYLPDCVLLHRIDELAYDLLIRERQLENYREGTEKLTKTFEKVNDEKKALKAQLTQLQAQKA